MEYIKTYEDFPANNKHLLSTFTIEGDKFKIVLGDTILSETGYNIEEADEWFNEKYVTLFNLKTEKKYQGKGYAKQLLENIFEYVKNELKINIISLIVDRVNEKALNLYLNKGFEIFMEYDDSFSLIKKL